MPRAKFPHLLSQDIIVWERFLVTHGRDYDRLEYDIRVGIGRDPGAEFPENTRTMAIDLSMRRIDAVGIRTDRLDIIEITTIAGIHAIGQLFAYPCLYRETFKPDLPLHPILVASELGPDILPVLLAHDLDYRLFPPTPPTPPPKKDDF